MKKEILIGAFCLLLGMVLVSGSAFAAAEGIVVNETGKAEETAAATTEAATLVQADAALKAELAEIFGQNEWLFPPSTSWICNQGAYCTYPNDPACGLEGFCHMMSNCCMCY